MECDFCGKKLGRYAREGIDNDGVVRRFCYDPEKGDSTASCEYAASCKNELGEGYRSKVVDLGER